MTTSLALIGACSHERAPIQPDAAAGKRSGTLISSPPADPVAAAAATASGDPAKSPVNTDLLKQGYRTRMHNGQLVYCRKEQITGTAFTSTLCLSEAQILDIQGRARDGLNAPARDGIDPGRGN